LMKLSGYFRNSGMELGISTFGEIAGAGEGYRRVQELIEEARRADEWGLDVFALEEHLSPADPVRVFQNFATLDLVSGGRAEIMAGRGSFIESFPPFGYNLKKSWTSF
jgi:alkanesulfonate monooxygenase SsuD/methylene tetrahydromethanopterin reductase-like flavin-dependent oxidoreductase (luciferase family)